ncbi:hypothetical protein A2159_00605 [Candidatus Woesebacteria bacterium RBG_13_34_9]|uniref:VanZ-like domain-containing protein n=1 Tax=Candidatus Woesebacteria bacterium RBG_13_34_9 TaxID=1802477 RepID=A0A1F7X420_9BACT|nr:MAG: hypothetical protein A2159_00605 [Candidatus Woesebacteria bacterium RBG_13_34_9]
MKIKIKKVILVVFMQLVIALIFVIGAGWASLPVYLFFQSYFADIIIPFAFYFLLTMQGDGNKFLNAWWKRALVILALTFASETLQYFGVYALARVFDPMDYLMYVIGVLLAAYVDRKIFTHAFSFWD